MSGLELDAIKFLLKTTYTVIARYVKLLSGAEKELEDLKKELDRMVSFVDDQRRVNVDNTNQHFKTLLKQTREVILDVEDVICVCQAEAEADQHKNAFNKVFDSGKKAKLAKKVGDLRLVFEELYHEFGKLSKADNAPDTGTETNATRKKEQMQTYATHHTVEMENLINSLIAESERLEVFSIVGMTGLGKSTLAWNIHEDPKIREEFRTIIWLRISRKLSVKEMLLTMLKEFEEEEDFSAKEVDTLQEIVRTHLKRGKFLIVLDDLWYTYDWDKINQLFPEENVKQAKVLITTQVSKLSLYATGRVIRPLRRLNVDESWKLLQSKVFDEGETCPTFLINIGKELAGKCNGIPLTIVVTGAALRHILKTLKGSIEVNKAWRDFSVKTFKVLWSSSSNARGGGEEPDEILNERVSHSYNAMSSDELKNCFIYLGVFPEDIEIPVWKLTQLWIAEGFIKYRDAVSFEDIARKYLNDLIDKNLLTITKMKPNGEVITVEVHDFIHDFCKKSSIFKEIKLTKQQDFEPELKSIKDSRHICIHSSVEKFLSVKPKFLKARSFLSFSRESIILKKNEINSINEAFEVLRILDVNMAIRFPKFPVKFGKLLLLKYITLSGEELEVLPKEIYSFLYVETLEVYTSLPTLTINSNIWKMMQLRHLKTKASIILKKDGKGKGGDKLQSLNRLSPESCTSEVLSKAKNLKALGIYGKLNQLNDSNCSLKEMKSLEKLKLVHSPSKGVDRNPLIMKLPEAKWFPKTLEILVLSGTNLSWDYMTTLAQLAKLEVLKLKANAFTGDFWNAKEMCMQGFDSLHTLQISESKFRYWSASGDKFPKLKYLILENCYELQCLPDDLVRGLELLYMDRVCGYAVMAARKIEKEIEKKREAQAGKIDGFKLEIVSRKNDMYDELLDTYTT